MTNYFSLAAIARGFAGLVGGGFIGWGIVRAVIHFLPKCPRCGSFTKLHASPDCFPRLTEVTETRPAQEGTTILTTPQGELPWRIQ